MVNPIKTNTSRLPGLLYRNIETTMNYYDKCIAAEKFMINYGDYDSSRTLTPTKNINEVYDKMLQSRK